MRLGEISAIFSGLAATLTSPRLMRMAVEARKLEAITQLRRVWTARMSRLFSMMDSTQWPRRWLVTPMAVVRGRVRTWWTR